MFESSNLHFYKKYVPRVEERCCSCVVCTSPFPFYVCLTFCDCFLFLLIFFSSPFRFPCFCFLQITNTGTHPPPSALPQPSKNTSMMPGFNILNRENQRHTSLPSLHPLVSPFFVLPDLDVTFSLFIIPFLVPPLFIDIIFMDPQILHINVISRSKALSRITITHVSSLSLIYFSISVSLNHCLSPSFYVCCSFFIHYAFKKIRAQKA